MARLQQESRRQSPQVQPHQPAFPARWSDGLYVVSLARRAFWPPSVGALVSLDLDTSIGVSGRHDFTVRTVLFVGVTRDHAARRRAHRIPHPTFVTTRTSLLPKKRKRKISVERPNGGCA